MCRETSSLWVVRLTRKDNDFRFYFLDRDCTVNARLSAAWRLEKDVAVQLVRALNASDTLPYRAKALRYTTSKRLEAERHGANAKQAAENGPSVAPDALTDADTPEAPEAN